MEAEEKRGGRLCAEPEEQPKAALCVRPRLNEIRVRKETQAEKGVGVGRANGGRA